MKPLLIQELHFIDDFVWSSREAFRHTTGHKTGYRLLLKKFPELLFYLQILPVDHLGNEVEVSFTWYQDTVLHEFSFRRPDTPTISAFSIVIPMLHRLADADPRQVKGHFDPDDIRALIEDAEESHQIAQRLEPMLEELDYEPQQTHKLSNSTGFSMLVRRMVERLTWL